jgi:hypothetical protein
MEAVCSSETLVSTYKFTRRYNPEVQHRRRSTYVICNFIRKQFPHFLIKSVCIIEISFWFTKFSYHLLHKFSVQQIFLHRSLNFLHFFIAEQFSFHRRTQDFQVSEFPYTEAHCNVSALLNPSSPSGKELYPLHATEAQGGRGGIAPTHT